MKKISVLLLLSLFLFAGDLLAETGLLHGTVARISGARLSNARITLTDAVGKVVVEGVSGPTGEFSLDVPLGEYDLKIDAGGFGNLKQRVRIVPGVLHLPLTVFQAPDGAVVPVDALQSNVNAGAIVLDEEFLSMLSDDNGEFASSLGGVRAFGPGATQASEPLSGGGVGGGLGVGAGGAFGFSGPFGGSPGGGFGGALGGVFLSSGIVLSPTSGAGGPGLSGPRASITRPEFIIDGQSGRLPLKDHVREVWIDSDPFTAEYSRPGFGRIHVSSLLVPREFHGSAAFNFRDESMDAPLAPTSGFTFPRQRYQSRHSHGEAGGTLIRERLFGSLAAMRLGQDSGSSVVSAVTPGGPVNLKVGNGSVDQIFAGRSQYRISERHQLHVNSRYRSEVFPNLGVGNTSLPEQGIRLALRGWDVQARGVSRLDSNTVHELRVQVRRDVRQSMPVKEGTTVNVVGSFSGGGTSSRSDYGDTQYQIENLFAWSTPQWTLRMGAQGYHIDRSVYSQGNVLGTFSFWNMADYQAGTPFQYFQNLGSTISNVRQTEFSTFAQGEWNASSRFSLSGGLRYEVQTNLRDRDNIDPRIALAYRIQSGLTLRVGAGVFHQRFNVEDVEDLAGADGAIVPSSIIMSNPAYPAPSPTAANISYFRRALGVRDPNLAAPYLTVGSVSLDKWFDNGFLISASVDVTRGMRQIRVRDMNAPYLADVADPSALTLAEVNERRPQYTLPIAYNRYESVGFLTSKNVSLRARTPELRVRKLGVRFNGDYTLGWSADDEGFPVDHYNRRAEWGRSTYSPRHNFWMGATTRAPWQVSLAALVRAHSGFPYSTLVFLDTNRDGYSQERPAGAKKNANEGPNSFNLDLKLSKTVTLMKRVEATLFAYGQNVFNTRNHEIFPSTFGSGSLILANGSMRRMELGVRLRF